LQTNEPKEKLVVVLNEPLNLKVQLEAALERDGELELKLLPTDTAEANEVTGIASQITEEGSEQSHLDA
jgi:hypothetical protein